MPETVGGSDVSAQSVARAVHRERLALLGWGRAIAMQFAHPLVAAGVGDHSSFGSGRMARFRRLHGTVRAMLSLTFGDEQRAFATAQGINTIHDRVHGVLKVDAGRFKAGTPYSAHDPVLLHWVLMTLLDSIPLAYTRMIGPLSPDEQDRYCQESTRLGRWLGIPEAMLPQSMEEVRTTVQRVMASGDLVVTDTARELMRDVLYPPFQLAYWPAAHMTRLATIGLLDPRLREQYGLAWTARDQRAFERWSGRLRAMRAVAPNWVRHWPETMR
jgi:uncharacterized protein (DUF2236 family)